MCVCFAEEELVLEEDYMTPDKWGDHYQIVYKNNVLESAVCKVKRAVARPALAPTKPKPFPSIMRPPPMPSQPRPTQSATSFVVPPPVSTLPVQPQHAAITATTAVTDRPAAPAVQAPVVSNVAPVSAPAIAEVVAAPVQAAAVAPAAASAAPIAPAVAIAAPAPTVSSVESIDEPKEAVAAVAVVEPEFVPVLTAEQQKRLDDAALKRQRAATALSTATNPVLKEVGSYCVVLLFSGMRLLTLRLLVSF